MIRTHSNGNVWNSRQEKIAAEVSRYMSSYIGYANCYLGVVAVAQLLKIRVMLVTGPEAERRLRAEMGTEFDELFSAACQRCLDGVGSQIWALQRPGMWGPSPQSSALDENPLIARVHLEYPSVDGVVDLLRAHFSRARDGVRR